MKRLYMTAYRYRQNLGEEDLRHLTKKFAELGTAPGLLAHYERLDGMGGFMIEDVSQEDTERSYELTLRYSPWIEMEVFPGREHPPGPDQDTRAERRVHLVTTPGQEIRLGGQRPVGRELGGVKRAPVPPVMRGRNDLRQRRQPACRVRGARDRQEPRHGTLVR